MNGRRTHPSRRPGFARLSDRLERAGQQPGLATALVSPVARLHGSAKSWMICSAGPRGTERIAMPRFF